MSGRGRDSRGCDDRGGTRVVDEVEVEAEATA